MKARTKETEKKLNDLFDDLKDNAYNAEFHNYYYKQTNQIIRKHFEVMKDYHKERLREELIDYDKWLCRTKWGGKILSAEKAVAEYLKSR